MLGARAWSNDEGGSAGVGVKQVCAYVCVKSPSVELPSEGVEGRGGNGSCRRDEGKEVGERVPLDAMVEGKGRRETGMSEGASVWGVE